MLAGRLFLALPHPAGVQPHLQAGGFLLQLRRGHARRGGGENRIGLRGLLIRQEPGVLVDDLGLVAVDGSGGHPGERGRQAAGKIIG